MKIRLLVAKDSQLLARVVVSADNNIDEEELIIGTMSVIKEIHKDTNEIPDELFRVDFIGYYLSFISYRLGLLFKM